MIPARHLPAIQLAVRASFAAALSIAIAQWLDLPNPLFALIAAVIVTDLQPSETRRLSGRRLIGTVIGAGLGMLASHWLPGNVVAIGVSVLVTMLVCHFLRLDGAARISGYICGLMILDHSDHPWAYAIDRLVETAIGIAVALAVSQVPKLVRIEEGQNP